MPAYRTRTAPPTRQAKRGKQKYAKRLPRDPAKLFRWAARGSLVDYEKLRDLARKARHSLPTHIDGQAFERLTQIDRLRMIEEIQAAEQHDVSAGGFLDALNWIIDKVPFGNWINSKIHLLTNSDFRAQRPQPGPAIAHMQGEICFG